MLTTNKGLSAQKSGSELVVTPKQAIRASKNLVELSIGIIGLIGIMLSYVGQQQDFSLMPLNVIQQSSKVCVNENVVKNIQVNDSLFRLNDNITRKVRNLTNISPSEKNINLMNILF